MFLLIVIKVNIFEIKVHFLGGKWERGRKEREETKIGKGRKFEWHQINWVNVFRPPLLLPLSLYPLCPLDHQNPPPPPPCPFDLLPFALFVCRVRERENRRAGKDQSVDMPAKPLLSTEVKPKKTAEDYARERSTWALSNKQEKKEKMPSPEEIHRQLRYVMIKGGYAIKHE